MLQTDLVERNSISPSYDYGGLRGWIMFRKVVRFSHLISRKHIRI